MLAALNAQILTHTHTHTYIRKWLLSENGFDRAVITNGNMESYRNWNRRKIFPDRASGTGILGPIEWDPKRVIFSKHTISQEEDDVRRRRGICWEAPRRPPQKWMHHTRAIPSPLRPTPARAMRTRTEQRCTLRPPPAPLLLRQREAKASSLLRPQESPVEADGDWAVHTPVLLRREEKRSTGAVSCGWPQTPTAHPRWSFALCKHWSTHFLRILRKVKLFNHPLSRFLRH